jgi:hypothetical protein
MKLEEKQLFETFVASHPDFLGINTWRAGPDPPDVVATDSNGRLIGIELTEWLDVLQTTPSISKEENKMRWLTTLDSENHVPPKNFKYAQIWFRGVARFSKQDESPFRKEFYDLAALIDEKWEREMAGTPQKIWNDFSGYPTLGRHILHIRFEDQAPHKPARWIIGTPSGGAYDPRRGTEVLLERIEEKRSKPKYAELKTELGLAELVLLLHYGIRGIIHNWPIEGLNWKIEDSIREARESLKDNPGPFDHAFLYLAFNEGQLFTLFP